MSFKIDIAGIGQQALNQVNAELPARAEAASQRLRSAALEILRGRRSGNGDHRLCVWRISVLYEK